MPKKPKVKPKQDVEKEDPGKINRFTDLFNSNAIHNLLNVVMSVVSVWALFDWTQFGLQQNFALKIIAGCAFLKLTINGVRDGLKGMVEPQSPVK